MGKPRRTTGAVDGHGDEVRPARARHGSACRPKHERSNVSGLLHGPDPRRGLWRCAGGEPCGDAGLRGGAASIRGEAPPQLHRLLGRHGNNDQSNNGGTVVAEKIRIGIVGATVTPGGSGWGANAHVPALRAVPDFEIAAVCTAHEDTAKASAAAFGVDLAFHNIDDMVAHPAVDMVVVCVRVPWHRDLVMAALRGGKPVFCEWPLGANLAEAEEMASFARGRSLRTIVGLQGRSDPMVRYAHDLVADGYIGEVLTANLSVMTQATVERGGGRLWQRLSANGANTLTIAGGHGIDAMCAIIGEFSDVSARITTRITEWFDMDAKQSVAVDAPDSISVGGRIVGGAEVSVQVAAVPVGASGSRLEIYGREGSLVLVSDGALSTGPNRFYGTKGREAAAEMPVPDKYVLVSEGTPTGSPRNVAQAYAGIADAWAGKPSSAPDFDLAVTRHRLIDAIGRSSREGRSISLQA
ncbi:MAG: Gfo/Idh/MocA family oxidoreductase [Dehalococcoidia bacterium]|nr:Gfo/Idh/MocA family oxidoreductase [Dehalococcoidia bacterium]